MSIQAVGNLHVLSIDIGTSGVRASVFDGSGAELENLRRVRHSDFAGDPAEFDSQQLLQTVIECLDELAEGCSGSGIFPHAAGVSCFWHGLLAIDDSVQPLSPLYTWADVRAAESAAFLRASLDETEIHQRTGCHLHQSFWPAKLHRLHGTDPALFRKAAKWISFPDLLHHALTGNLVTSVSMASATGLFDQRECRWDEDLAGAFGVSPDKLPPIAGDRESDQLIPEFKKRWPAFADAEWFPAVGDGAANNLGTGCVGFETAAIMVGTSAAIRLLFEGEVPDAVPEGLFSYRLDRSRIVLGGALSDGGSLYEWLTGSLKLDISDGSLEKRFTEAFPGDRGLAFLPFVFGERSTGYHPEARGAVMGITRGTDAHDIALAAFGGMAFRLSEILSRIENVASPKRLVVSGGAIESSSFLARLIADVLGRNIRKLDTGLASLRGAALFALEQTGKAQFRAIDPEAGQEIAFDRGRQDAYRMAKQSHSRFYDRMFPAG